MPPPFIAILMGSDSDLPVMQAAIDTLSGFEIPFEVNILSAHRTPDDTHDYVRDADERGCVAFIAGAGMAAHLAGAIAANTLKPVIGIPIDSGSLGGLDSLLSTVQMPGGMPVATVTIGKAGAKNAGYLAAQIMAITDQGISARLKEDRARVRESIVDKNKKLSNKLSSQ